MSFDSRFVGSAVSVSVETGNDSSIGFKPSLSLVTLN
ncbi:MAG: hypothetical protein ACD_46C00025G0004 [uncultured bacterium]|nr:MAG: hypothetical protein ACD_46C00025G0004 [uncultured bacterium]